MNQAGHIVASSNGQMSGYYTGLNMAANNNYHVAQVHVLLNTGCTHERLVTAHTPTAHTTTGAPQHNFDNPLQQRLSYCQTALVVHCDVHRVVEPMMSGKPEMTLYLRIGRGTVVSSLPLYF
jgi:hypothetical protein